MRTPALYKPFLSLPPSPFPRRRRGPAAGAAARQFAGGERLRGARPGSASARLGPAPALLCRQMAQGEFPAAPARISEGSPAGAGTFLFALAKPKVIQFALITTISPELSPDSDRRSL